MMPPPMPNMPAVRPASAHTSGYGAVDRGVHCTSARASRASTDGASGARAAGTESRPTRAPPRQTAARGAPVPARSARHAQHARARVAAASTEMSAHRPSTSTRSEASRRGQCAAPKERPPAPPPPLTWRWHRVRVRAAASPRRCRERRAASTRGASRSPTRASRGGSAASCAPLPLARAASCCPSASPLRASAGSRRRRAGGRRGRRSPSRRRSRPSRRSRSARAAARDDGWAAAPLAKAARRAFARATRAASRAAPSAACATSSSQEEDEERVISQPGQLVQQAADECAGDRHRLHHQRHLVRDERPRVRRCWRRTLNAKLATAPPRIVTLASGVDSCGVNASATMKSGTSSPPPPMPAPALMAHAEREGEAPPVAAVGRPHVLVHAEPPPVELDAAHQLGPRRALLVGGALAAEVVGRAVLRRQAYELDAAVALLRVDRAVRPVLVRARVMGDDENEVGEQHF